MNISDPSLAILYNATRLLLDVLEDLRPAGGFRQPKKTVTKGVETFRIGNCTVGPNGKTEWIFTTPNGAYNIRGTYEIEE